MSNSEFMVIVVFLVAGWLLGFLAGKDWERKKAARRMSAKTDIQIAGSKPEGEEA